MDGKHEEKRFAKRHNLKRQPASGALRVPRLKGDCVDDLTLYDLKSTEAVRYILTYATMRKLEKEAAGASKMPCLAVRFHTKDAEYAVLRIDDFNEIMRVYRENT